MRIITLFLLTINILVVEGFSQVKIHRPIIHHSLDITLDPVKHRVKGVANLIVKANDGKQIGFLLNKSFKINYPKANEYEVENLRKEQAEPLPENNYLGLGGKWDTTEAVLWVADLPHQLRKAEELNIEIVYAGNLYVEPDDRQFSRETIAMEVSGTIGEEGVFLSPSAYWYPTLPTELSSYEVKVTMPPGWSCVTNGMPNEVVNKDNNTIVTHHFDHLSDAISLSAGQYEIKLLEREDVMLAAYFFSPQIELADGYLDACDRYVDMYSNLIAPYPFTKFAVVDNFLPSGYGMPGWTLLGSEVIKRSFIMEISLGHEVAHNWWGNSLYVNYDEGNWCEGLTVYMADYKYKEDASPEAAREYRMDVLSKYAAYVTEENDYPVSKFSERSNPADRAIGYNKVMMIFHMLKAMSERIEAGLFHKTLSSAYIENQWQVFGWSDWEKAFEKSTNRQLDWFFDQWVSKPGAPRIEITEGKTVSLSGGFAVGSDVITHSVNKKPYRYNLPVVIETSTGITRENIEIKQAKQRLSFTGKGTLISITLDPDFEVFRHIYQGEMPLTIAEFFGDPDAMLITPASGANSEIYQQVAEGLKKENQKVAKDNEVFTSELSGSIWLFGSPEENEAWDKISTKADTDRLLNIMAELIVDQMKNEPLVTTVIAKHPITEGKVLVYTIASESGNILAGTRMLPHYGKYSYLVFNEGKNVIKGKSEPDGVSPMRWVND